MNNTTLTNNISKTKVRELDNLFILIKEEKTRLIKNEIFKNIIVEAIHDKNYYIKNNLTVKVNDIILREELANNLTINEKFSQLLDPEEFTNLELTFEEENELKQCIEHKVKDKEDIILKDVKMIVNTDFPTIHDIKEAIKHDSQIQNDILIETQKGVNNLQLNHMNLILKLGDTLLKLLDLKNSAGKKNMEEKAEQILNESKKYNYRTKLLEQKACISIFNNNPMTLNAYKIAYEDLKEQQKILIDKIEELRLDLNKYNILAKNDEYQKILHYYKQYLKTIEQKEWLCKEILKK